VRADRRLLELFAHAFANGESVARDANARRLPGHLTWSIYEETLATFIEGLSPVEREPARLRAMLAALHLRPSLHGASLLQSLGVDGEQAAVLRAIEAAFPPQPRVGRALLEAVLDDERAFRPVAESELEAARASAERDNWRRIPAAEIEAAFAMNSVGR
jgi:hypothetical protein